MCPACQPSIPAEGRHVWGMPTPDRNQESRERATMSSARQPWIGTKSPEKGRHV